jgi:transcriptional regulator with XRE-family HTH domain
MIIGNRVRALRKEEKLSQGDIEKHTGLVRPHISRIENGHTVPSIETLEKMGRALEIPMYQLFYEGEEPPELPNLPKRKSSDGTLWESTGKDARYQNKLCRLLKMLYMSAMVGEVSSAGLKPNTNFISEPFSRANLSKRVLHILGRSQSERDHTH